MTTFVLSVLDKLKQTRVVADSLQLASITWESYQLYKKEVEKKADHADLRNAEDIYFEAATTVTHQNPKQIRQRPDYRLIASAAKNIRKARGLSDVGLSQVTSLAATLYSKSRQFAESFFGSFEVKIDSLMNRWAYLVNRGTIILRNLRAEIAFATDAAGSIASEWLLKLLNSDILGYIGAAIKTTGKAAWENYNFYAHFAKNVSIACFNTTADYFNSFKAYQWVRNIISSELQNIRKAYHYTTKTIAKNEGSVLKLKNYSFNYVSTSFDKNYKLLHLLFNENVKLLKSFFEHFDVEVFYSPKSSIKIVEDARAVCSIVLGERPRANSPPKAVEAPAKRRKSGGSPKAHAQ